MGYIIPWRFGGRLFSFRKMGDGCRFQPLIVLKEDLAHVFFRRFGSGGWVAEI